MRQLLRVVVVRTRPVHRGARRFTDGFTDAGVEAVGSDHYAPVRAAHAALGTLHDLGLSWVGVALAVPLLLRTVLVPMVVTSQRSLERDAPEMVRGMQILRSTPLPDKESRERKVQEVTAEIGFNPLTRPYRPMLVGLMTAPVHMTLFFSFRCMADAFPSWQSGGALWFADLSAADPYFVLPAVVGAFTCAQFQLLASGMPGNDKQQEFMRSMMQSLGYGLGVGSIPVMYHLGAGFNLYAMSNLACTLLQQLAMRNNAARAAVGLQPLGWLQEQMKGMTAAPETQGGGDKDEDLQTINRLLVRTDLTADDREALERMRRIAPFIEDNDRDALRRMAQARQQRAQNLPTPMLAVQVGAVIALIFTWMKLERQKADEADKDRERREAIRRPLREAAAASEEPVERSIQL